MIAGENKNIDKLSKVNNIFDSKEWTLEDNVNDWVKSEFTRISQRLYTVESAMSEYLKDAIQRGVIIKRKELEDSGEKEKGKSWKPDFELEAFNIPVIIEDKLGLNKLYAGKLDSIKQDIKSVQNYAVNGAIHYAQCAIMSKKYSEVIAIGIAGDNIENVSVKVYYVYGSTDDTYKLVKKYTTLDFLESKSAFEEFYKEATLTENEKHQILIDSRAKLQLYAKKLNKLMHNHSITAPQRVLYVSGMLLAMQDLKDFKKGLVPEDLKGIDLDKQRDGDIIVNHIENFLQLKEIPSDKVNLMMSSFKEINKDTDRDTPLKLDDIVNKYLSKPASVNKQIFTYIYTNIFLSIDSMSGHLDIMGEMYSEFLKYALGDGKEIGIVLTPPYVTKMMARILGVDKDSKVMDLATGSAGFLISSMQLMIEDAERIYGKKTTKALNKINEIKKNQLLGIELNAEMFTLASTNMILRGDGASNIRKGSSFSEPHELYEKFKADRLLLNPPFSFEENGMPFIRFGLENMKIGGKAAIIIQDSAGSGKAIKSCQSILGHNQLLTSIKMPMDLFVPMAGVQTSIYVIEHTGKKHDFSKQVMFIDFRNDGYKRTKRGLVEKDNPMQRYNDIIEIYKNGLTANVSTELWDIQSEVVMDVITSKGDDWNYDKHQIIDTKPTLKDFKKTVSDYLAWEVSELLKRQNRMEEDLGK
jgi:type I restriction enzyme M protein